MMNEIELLFLLPESNSIWYRNERIMKLIDSKLNRSKMLFAQAFYGFGKSVYLIQYLNEQKIDKQCKAYWFDFRKNLITDLKKLTDLLEDQKTSMFQEYIVFKNIPYQLEEENIQLLQKIIRPNSTERKVLFISEGRIPRFLIEEITEGRLALLTPPEMILTESEAKEYISKQFPEKTGIIDSFPIEIPRIPITLNVVINFVYDKDIVMKIGWEFIKTQVFQIFEEKLLKKLSYDYRYIIVMMAMFDKIEKSLVLYIMEDEYWFEVLERFSQEFCVLLKLNEHTYHLSQYLQGYMRSNIDCLINLNEKIKLYHKAIGYYTYCKDYENAISFAIKLNDQEMVIGLLEKYLSEVQYDGNNEFLNKVLRSISKEELQKYPYVCAWLCLKELIYYQLGLAKRYYAMILDELKKYRKNSVEYTRIYSCILLLNCVMPGVPRSTVYHQLKEARNRYSLDEISEYLFHTRNNAAGFYRLLNMWNDTKDLEIMVQSESYYHLLGERILAHFLIYIGMMSYKSTEYNKAVHYLTKGNEISNKNDMLDAVAYSGYYLQKYYNQEDTITLIEINKRYKRLLANNPFPLLDLEYEAYEMWYALLNYDVKKIDEWWERSKLVQFDSISVVHNRYVFLYIKVAIIKKQYNKAQAWLEIYNTYFRVYGFQDLLLECKLYLAILHYHKGNKTSVIEHMNQFFKLLEKIPHIKVLVQHGVLCQQLMSVYLEKYPEFAKNKFYADIVAESVTYAVAYPKYFHKEMEELPQLTKAETNMLRLLEQDLSLLEIAQMLSVSINTVKHHTKNIYAKLKVNKRIAAIRVAKELGLLMEYDHL